MAKSYTFPTLIEELKTIKISNLKKWGYLKNGISTNLITWRRGEEITGRASITVCFFVNNEYYIELDYKLNGEPIKYKVKLESLPSNLGIGKRWYFVCPITKKRCTTLYQSSKYFLHRETLKNAMYESQTYSKSIRMLVRYLSQEKRREDVFDRKYLKRHYRGVETKLFKKCMKIS